MRAIALQAMASGLLAANALQNAPRLTESIGITRRARELIPAREGAAIEKDFTLRILAEQITRNLQHHTHTEFVLLGGVLDVWKIEERGANMIFVDHGAAEFRSQCPA